MIIYYTYKETRRGRLNIWNILKCITNLRFRRFSKSMWSSPQSFFLIFFNCFHSESITLILYCSFSFLLEYSFKVNTMLSLLHRQVNQLHISFYPICFGFSSHFDHHRALKVPCAIEHVFISYLLHTYDK